MVRVLIAEKNREIADYLSALFTAERMTVAGIARNGREALEMARRLVPDVLLLNLNLADTDAVSTTAAIMRGSALPIVLIVDPGEGPEGAERSFQAMKAGALAAVLMPDRSRSELCMRQERELLKTVRAMSEVRVVTRRGRNVEVPRPKPPSGPDMPVIAIGASTGGPPVLQTILGELPRNLPAALLIVQHISPGFLEGLRHWLQQTAGFPVHIPEDGDSVLPGRAYLAPDNRHMGISSWGRIILSSSPPEAGLRPAVSYLFRSVTETYGSRTCGVLLTGMGMDGVAELKIMRDSGGTTIVQDKASSAIFGMPGRAVEIGAAAHVYNPRMIARALPEIAARIMRNH